MGRIKGWFGEKKATFRMWYSLNSKVYRRFHHVIIPSKNGTTQIDHLLISPYGLFIIETKNRKGWIFGSVDQKKWTQSIYGRNYSFQNPLRQVYRQKKVLSEFLEIRESKILTVIYFAGDCKFQTEMPANVIKSRLGRYVKQFKDVVLSAEEMVRMVRKMEHYISESSLTPKDHMRSLRQRHQSATICPRCGSKLVERTANKGPNAGSMFLGCENFPKCRFTKSLS